MFFFLFLILAVPTVVVLILISAMFKVFSTASWSVDTRAARYEQREAAKLS